MSRKIKKNGVMTNVSLDKNKKYKYSPTGDLVESTGTLGDNEISMSGSKSSLRRAADMERNISILATTMLTTDGGVGIDSPAEVKAAAATDATSKANAALASAKAYADQAEADAESAASSDATSKANNAKSQAISAASSDATTKANAALVSASSDATSKANNAKSQAIAAAASDATTKANNAKAQAIAAVTNGAGAAFDTLVEIQNAMATDSELSSAISSVTSSAAATASADATTKANAALAAAKVYADANTADPTLTLTGDVTGSATFTNLGNATLTAVVANNSHEHSQLYENSTITYGTSQLQWTDISGTDGTGTNGGTPKNPTNDWYHHIITNHANGGGYYYDLSLPFHQDELFFRRVTNGSQGAFRKVWHDGNDGSGSGLDADLLDGLQASAFVLESNVNNYVGTGWSNVVGKIPRIAADGRIELGRYTDFKTTNSNADYDIRLDCESANVLNVIGGGLEIGGNVVWHAGNDGSGSGLDADLLDGQQGSAYLLKTGGTVTGATTFSAPLKVVSSGKTLDFGSLNSTWCHFNTTATSGFYFYDDVYSASNITAYSDIRVKTDIKNIPNALDKVCRLNGYTFTRTDGKHKGLRQTGVVAQEVQKELPEAVVTDPENGHLSVAYGNMVGLLIESIKEQQVQIDEQNARIDELTSRLDR